MILGSEREKRLKKVMTGKNQEFDTGEEQDGDGHSLARQ